MGEPAELTPQDVEITEAVAARMVDAVAGDYSDPLEALYVCSKEIGATPNTLALWLSQCVLRGAQMRRDFSAAHVQAGLHVNPVAVIPDLVSEAQQKLAEDAAAMKRAEEARALYGKPSKAVRVRLDRGDFMRVSGQVLCEVCQVAYSDHDPVIGFPWLRHGCDGRLLKP